MHLHRRWGFFFAGNMKNLTPRFPPKMLFKSERWWVFNTSAGIPQMRTVFSLLKKKERYCYTRTIWKVLFMFKKTQTVFSFLWWWFLISKRNAIATAFPCQGWNHFCNWNVRGVFGTGPFWFDQVLRRVLEAYTKLSHPLKPPKKHLPVCPFLFPKKDINILTPQQLLHLSTPSRSSRSLLPSVINASRREGIPCRYVGSCPPSPLGWSSNTTVVSEEIGHIPWRSGGASVGVGRGRFPRKRKMTSGGTLWGLKVLSTPIFVPPQTKYQHINIFFLVWGCGEEHIW